MFSLIITIISIALIAALAAATIYYGGDAFSKGTLKADASTLINQGQQVAGAMTLYSVDKSQDAADVTALVTDGYLQANPGSWDVLEGTSGLVSIAYNNSPDLTEDVCNEVRSRNNETAIVFGTDAPSSASADDAADAVQAGGVPFTCVAVGADAASAVPAMFFKS